MTQTQSLANAMRKRWMTPLDALAEFGCFRLGARVWELKRAGVVVHEKWVTTKNGKRVKAFMVAR